MAHERIRKSMAGNHLVGICILILVGALSALQLAGLQPAKAGPSFEVASVKASDGKEAAQPANERERGSAGIRGRFDLRKVQLTYLVMRAFDIEARQVSGPAWLDEQTYDVRATAPAGTSSGQIPLMFQNLLIERFGMKWHFEDPAIPVYTLVLARGGVRAKAGLPDDDPYNYGQIAQKAARDGVPTASARTSQYGVYRLSMTSQGLRYEYLNIKMKALAQFLGRQGGPLELPVVDMTGLSGEYQITLDIPRSDVHCGSRSFAADQPEGTASDPCGSTIRASLQKQGLQLVRRNIPYRKVVIESIQRTPKEN